MAETAPPNESGFVRANLERTLVVGPNFASYYANDTMVQTSPWDVRLMFGLVSDVDITTGRALVERVADVRISLQHAKRVAAILTEQIRQYEARIGFLALPPED